MMMYCIRCSRGGTLPSLLMLCVAKHSLKLCLDIVAAYICYCFLAVWVQQCTITLLYTFVIIHLTIMQLLQSAITPI